MSKNKNNINKVKKITKDNIKDLDFLKDILSELLESGYTIEMPELLSLNKTENQYVKTKGNKSAIILWEMSKESYDKIDKEDSLILTLVVTNK